MRLVGTIDLTGKSDLELAVETLDLVAERYKQVGIDISKPIILIIEDMPIMGASEPLEDAYRLHLGSHAVASGMLDGLIAHEVAHMALMDKSHPSHSREIHQRISRALKVPKPLQASMNPIFRLANNHVQDVYADDIAFPIIGDGRAGIFFSNWVRNSSVARRSRSETIANEVTVAFGIGNMQRHGIQPDPIVSRQVEAFATNASLHFLPEMTSGFRELPTSDDPVRVEEAMMLLLGKILRESHSEQTRQR